MKSEGKKFEEDFKKSVPDDLFYYRLIDGTSSWDGGNARFQAKNICDCLIMGKKWLRLIELKSFKGKSFPFGNIDLGNLEKMVDAFEKKGSSVESSVVFNFRDLEKTFAVDAFSVEKYIQGAERKSIPLAWFEDDKNKWTCALIPQTKKRTRFTYDLSIFR